FVKDKTMIGFFNYDSLINNPKIGDILKVRIEPVGTEGFHKAFTLEKIEDSTDVNLPALKIISGTIRLPENKGFGFIDDIFIPPNLVESSGLTDGQTISVKAILSYNKSKKEWGWKGLEVLV